MIASAILALLGFLTPQEPPASDAWLDRDIRPLLSRYCVACHGSVKTKGKLNLEVFLPSRKVLSVVEARLRAKEMPPEDAPQPSTADLEKLLRGIDRSFGRIDELEPPPPGRVTMRRLNRAEYTNTIRDLLSLRFDLTFDPTRDFPADGAGYGFDTIGDVLSTSPLLMEKYLAAADQILDRTIVVDGLDGPRTRRWSAAELRRSAPGDALEPRNWIAEVDVRQAGDYLVRAELRSDQPSRKQAQMAFVTEGRPPDQFSYSRADKPSIVERKIRLEKGRRQVWVSYAHEYGKAAFDAQVDGANGRIFVDGLEISGPVNLKAEAIPEGHRRVFVTRPSKEKSRLQAAKEVLSAFAARAFRRPAGNEEIARLVKLFELADRDGETFEGALRTPLQAILVSPGFLYRVELERSAGAGGAYALDPWELASRLSYFLWSSMPDDELFAHAANGKLSDPAVLELQACRMMQDPRASALSENFVTQWLQLGSLETFVPAPKIGKIGTDLREAMLKEPILLFEEIRREDRSVLELLQAPYSYMNAVLARHYGLPIAPENSEKAGKGAQSRMVRYVLPDQRRGGVLTMAAVLAVTSHPDRTSPVKRGKWVLDALLNAPPPPPPPEVMSLLEADTEKTSKLSLRERFVAHRSDPACATCHRRMDPIGFGFENYDALGRWRDKESGRPIDASAVLPDGRSFNGPVELKKVFLDRKDEFVRALTEKMMTYSLGRGLESYDRKAVESITATLRTNDFKYSGLILGIVKSAAFRSRSMAEEKR